MENEIMPESLIHGRYKITIISILNIILHLIDRNYFMLLLLFKLIG